MRVLDEVPEWRRAPGHSLQSAWPCGPNAGCGRRHEIQPLARRARIELSDQPLAATGPLPPVPVLAPLGLTVREVDGLRLLAAAGVAHRLGLDPDTITAK